MIVIAFRKQVKPLKWSPKNHSPLQPSCSDTLSHSSCHPHTPLYIHIACLFTWRLSWWTWPATSAWVALYRSKEPRSNTTVSEERDAHGFIIPNAMKILSVVKVHTEALYTGRCPYMIEAAAGNCSSNRDKKMFLISQAKSTRWDYQIRGLFSDSNY